MKALIILSVSLFLVACGGSSGSSSPQPGLIAEFRSTAYTNCIRTYEGEFKCWGDGEDYNFATGLDELITDDPTEVGAGIPAAQLGDTPIIDAQANEYFGCALYLNNTVRCWGNKRYVGLDDPASDPSNYVGDDPSELGNGLPIINFGANLYATQLSLGNGHACVVLNNGRVKCWGEGRDGRLGQGAENDLGNDAGEMGDNLPYVDLGRDGNNEHYTVKQIAAGYDLTCAVLSNDQLKCWGENDSAQLGYGDFNSRGDEPNEMGDNLPVVDLGTGRSVKEVFVYYVHTCAILDNDALKCWGDNRDGEIGLGTGDTYVGDNVVPPSGTKYCGTGVQPATFTTTALNPGDPNCEFGGSQWDTVSTNNGTATRYYCNAHDMNMLTRTVNLPAGDQDCLEGGFLIEAEHDTNGDGNFSDGADNNMGDNLAEIDFGSSSPVVDVILGDDHTCGLLADGTLKCWGENDVGQSGLDTTEPWGDGPNETPANIASPDLGAGLYPTSIAGSYDFSCATLNDDTIKCWGSDNDYATLGVPEYFEDYIGDGDPVDEMGEALQALELF